MSFLSIAVSVSGTNVPELIERAFIPGETYDIDDEHPWLYFRIGPGKRGPIKLSDDSTGTVEAVKGILPGDGWHRWCPLEKRTFSNERRFGIYLSALNHSDATLRCCLWPRRLFGRAQLSALVQAIQDELGRPVLWERSDSAVRAFVLKTAEGGLNGEELIDFVSEELRAVADLRRSRVVDDDEDPGPSPERVSLLSGYLDDESIGEKSLVSIWAAARLRQMMRLHRSLESARISHEDAVRESARNRMAVESREKRIAEIRLISAKTLRMTAVLRELAERYAYARTAFQLQPSMQRDHRLRRLLAALAPKKAECLSDTTSETSSLPPLKAPDLFELWGGVSLARALKHLGWERTRLSVGHTAEEWGLGSVEYCQWRFTKNDEHIVLDFAPRIKVVSASDLPPMHGRREEALVRAASSLTEKDILFSINAHTPDYTIRWSSGEARALIVGDASLADPRFQAGEKVETICNYRPFVAWFCDDGRIVRCDRGGATFALLPGPRGIWEGTKVEETAAALDCYALLPEPGADCHVDLVERLSHLLDSLPRV